jgi:hypothetical protein
MATTTNYGWVTPDDTSLVKDGAAAIRTLGSSVDTTTKALNPSTTLGDIEFRSATANTNTRLGIGSSGNVLTVAGGVPTWAAPAAGGGGKVLQVVNASTGTQVTNSTTTHADTTLTASITPTLNTSKILVLVSQNGIGKSAGNASNACDVKLLRGATFLTGITAAAETQTALQLNVGGIGFCYLDSPATTSSTTYKTTFANINGSAYAAVQFAYGTTYSNITLLEIGA